MGKRSIPILFLIILSIMKVQSLYAQDFDLTSINLDLPGIAGQGSTAAALSTGFLNTAINDAKGLQPNSLPTANTRDVAVGDFNADAIQDIIAITADDTNRDGIPDIGQLILFPGLGNGTFKLPQLYRTAGLPIAIAVADIDLDGVSDVVVAEQGFVEVFTGFFLKTGRVTNTDRIGSPKVSPSDGALKTAPGNGIIALALGNLDGDSLADIVIAEQGNASGAVEVFLTVANGGKYSLSGIATNIISTKGTIGVSGTSKLSAVRAIAIQQSNLSDTPSSAADSDLDIFVATSMGIEIFENASTNFMAQPVLAAGTNPVGVLALDVNSDNRIDILALNHGSGTLSTFLATPTPGYEKPLIDLVGQKPISLRPVNYDGDSKIDIMAVNVSGDISILINIGKGLYEPARSLNKDRRLPLINPQSIIAGRLDLSSASDDLIVAEGMSPPSPGGVLYLSAKRNYNPVPLQVFSTISPMVDLDGVGNKNDVVLIEQNVGFIFILSNAGTPQQNVRTIEVTDLFTKSTLVPTSATAFRDNVTGRNNLAITAVDVEKNNSGGGQLIIGINTGSGISGFRQFIATSGATNLLSGDFNNDGSDDLVYIDCFSNLAAVAINNGGNSFIDFEFRETGGRNPVSAAVADVNDDDILDLVVANQGLSMDSDQSSISVLIGQGDGRLIPTGSPLPVPNFVLSIVGGLSDFSGNGIQRLVDFNNDGFPDFAVVSTRGASNGSTFVPTVTLLLNRADRPGSFSVQQPIPLVDPSNISGIQLEASLGGPGIVSGQFGDPSTRTGIGLGGANSIMAVNDFNADGSPDLVVTGTRLINSSNFRSSIFLIGNGTSGTMRVVSRQSSDEYGGTTSTAVADTFIACLTTRGTQSSLPNVLHVSLNGKLWLDSNVTSVVNQAPVLTIRRQDLKSPLPGSGRKVIISSGQTASIPVSGIDPDGDRLTFRLATTPDGQEAPSMVTIRDNGNNTATVMVNSGDINRGPGERIFRIAVEASDGAKGNVGERRPLTARAYFTLVVKPNAPPTISGMPNLTVEAGKTTTVQLSIVDKEEQNVTTTVKCDKGAFITAAGTVLTLKPQADDIGLSVCTVTSADEFGLSDSISFTVTVVKANLPPTLVPIADQIVKAGDIRTLIVKASDPNDSAGLKLSIVSAPAFVSLVDNGDGSGIMRIVPGQSDLQTGRVVIQVADPAGLSAQTSFNLTVQSGVTITEALFAKPNLFINGSGFGNSAVKVTVNGKDVSLSILRQSDNSLILKGSKKRLNLKAGPNQITVTSGGTTSNTYILNLQQ